MDRTTGADSLRLSVISGRVFAARSELIVRKMEMTTMKIFDARGDERDMAWLRAEYGNIRVERVGAPCFQLVEIRETDGPAILMVCVLNEQGGAQEGQPVAVHWPDAGLQDLTGGGLKTLPFPRACVQRVDSTGWTGFGLGGGSYITNPEVGGPHTVWVASPSLPADVVFGLGWKALTNHRGPMRLTFRLVNDVMPEPEPEPEPEPGSGLVRRLDRLMTLVVPQVAGTRKPATMVARAVETLALLEAEVGDDE